MKEREKREISSAAHARDLKQLEQEQEISGSAKAGTSGALGGMVQSKGQRGKGKLVTDDPRIKTLKEEYMKDPIGKAKRELQELGKQAKKEKSPKKRNKLLKQKDALKGAIKLMDRFFIRMPFVTPFSKDQLKDISRGINPDDKII